MFSFGEITLTVLIALFVVGPERLPTVARTVGRYWRQINQYFDNAKIEINNFLDETKPKKLTHQTREPHHDAADKKNEKQ